MVQYICNTIATGPIDPCKLCDCISGLSAANLIGVIAHYCSSVFRLTFLQGLYSEGKSGEFGSFTWIKESQGKLEKLEVIRRQLHLDAASQGRISFSTSLYFVIIAATSNICNCVHCFFYSIPLKTRFLR